MGQANGKQRRMTVIYPGLSVAGLNVERVTKNSTEHCLTFAIAFLFLHRSLLSGQQYLIAISKVVDSSFYIMTQTFSNFSFFQIDLFLFSYHCNANYCGFVKNLK